MRGIFSLVCHVVVNGVVHSMYMCMVDVMPGVEKIQGVEFFVCELKIDLWL